LGRPHTSRGAGREETARGSATAPCLARTLNKPDNYVLTPLVTTSTDTRDLGEIKPKLDPIISAWVLK